MPNRRKMGKLLLWKHFYAIYLTPSAATTAVVGWIIVIQFTFFFELKYYYFLIKSRIFYRKNTPPFIVFSLNREAAKKEKRLFTMPIV